MKELDVPERPADSTLNCYRSALRDLRANLVVTSPEFKRNVQSRLDRLIATVSRKTTNEILESTAARLSDILTEYHTNEEHNFEQEQFQLRKTIEALEALVRSIAEQDHECSDNLNVVLTGLEDTLFEGDLLSIHRNLQEQIRRLRTCVVTISEGAQEREAGLEQQISSLRATAEQRPDPTADRNEQRQTDAGSLLNGYLESCTLFSLIFIRLDDLPLLARHWSFSCRTALFSAIESRLRNSMGTLVNLHPWGEGEFVVIMRSTLARALERAENLRLLVNNAWNIDVPFGQAKIEVRCSIGVAEYVSGEDLSSLLSRTQDALAADGAARGKTDS